MRLTARIRRKLVEDVLNEVTIADEEENSMVWRTLMVSIAAGLLTAPEADLHTVGHTHHVCAAIRWTPSGEDIRWTVYDEDRTYETLINQSINDPVVIEDEELYLRVKRWKARKNEITSNRRALNIELERLVKSVCTLKRLYEVWPAGKKWLDAIAEEYVPAATETPVQLASSVTNLMAQFGEEVEA